jgi:hypothetical protein
MDLLFVPEYPTQVSRTFSGIFTEHRHGPQKKDAEIRINSLKKTAQHFVGRDNAYILIIARNDRNG